MNIKLDRKELKNKVKLLASIIKAGNNIAPISSAIYMLVDKEQLFLTANNTKTKASVVMDIKSVVDSGFVIVPYKQFCGFIDKCSGEDINIESLENKDSNKNINVKISTAKTEFILQGYDEVGYFDFTFDKENVQFTLDGKRFKNMIQKVVHSTSDDATRPILQGVHFKVQNKKLSIVATDGRRLSLSECDFDIDDVSFTMDKNILTYLKDINISGDVLFCLYDDIVKLECADKTALVICLIKGVYPSYEKLIPTDNPKVSVEIEKKSLSYSIDMLSIIFDDVKNFLVIMDCGQNQITLTGENIHMGNTNKCHDTFSVEYNGEVFEISYNGKYVKDAMESCVSDKFKFNYYDSNSPFMIIDNDYREIVMPMRRNNN